MVAFLPEFRVVIERLISPTEFKDVALNFFVDLFKIRETPNPPLMAFSLMVLAQLASRRAASVPTT